MFSRIGTLFVTRGKHMLRPRKKKHHLSAFLVKCIIISTVLARPLISLRVLRFEQGCTYCAHAYWFESEDIGYTRHHFQKRGVRSLWIFHNISGYHVDTLNSFNLVFWCMAWPWGCKFAFIYTHMKISSSWRKKGAIGRDDLTEKSGISQFCLIAC